MKELPLPRLKQIKRDIAASKDPLISLNDERRMREFSGKTATLAGRPLYKLKNVVNCCISKIEKLTLK